MADPRLREMAGKRAALALAALHVEPAAMALQGMLHDGEPQARAALPAGTPRIHSIEPLRPPRNVLGGYADAAVHHGEVGPLPVHPPAHAYGAPCRRRRHSVDQEIGER